MICFHHNFLSILNDLNLGGLQFTQTFWPLAKVCASQILLRNHVIAITGISYFVNSLSSKSSFVDCLESLCIFPLPNLIKDTYFPSWHSLFLSSFSLFSHLRKHQQKWKKSVETKMNNNTNFPGLSSEFQRMLGKRLCNLIRKDNSILKAEFTQRNVTTVWQVAVDKHPSAFSTFF